MRILHTQSGLEFETGTPVLVGDNPNNIGFVIYVDPRYYFKDGQLLPMDTPSTGFDGMDRPTGWIVVRASEFVPGTITILNPETMEPMPFSQHV